jgi:hypothetical protein
MIRLNKTTKKFRMNDKIIFYDSSVFSNNEAVIKEIENDPTVYNPYILIMNVSQYLNLFFDSDALITNVVSKDISLKELLKDLSEEQRECK